MPLLRLLAFVFLLPAAQGQKVFINELHYDNTGVDAGEGLEIAGPAGTDLSQYDVVYYNGAGGNKYGSLRLSGLIDDEGTGTGAVWFDIVGLQNGAPDGLVLYHWLSATVVHRISYEGAFTAVGGEAREQYLPDINVLEGSATAAGDSLQLTGNGTGLADFVWNAPRAASPGALNTAQTFTANLPRTATLTMVTSLLTEGQSGTLTLSVQPAPTAGLAYALSANRSGVLGIPAVLTVPVSGSISVPVTALTDNVADGFQEVALNAVPADNTWPAAATGVQVVDEDRPIVNAPGALRVMSFNVRLGLSAPGSADFNAVREIVERISPDVLCLQEVSSTGDFGDFLSLAAQCGFPSSAAHRAISGDAFAGQHYIRGDISGGSDVNVVTLSRWPITQRIQLGRGAAGRAEITRYPLLTVVDIPWLNAAEDPAIVNVHLKADGDESSAFRRALEAMRTREYMAAAGFNPTTDNVMVIGDFNANDRLPQVASWQTKIPALMQPGTGKFADGSALPFSFVPGSDLTTGITLPYATFPHSGFNSSGLTAVALLQPDRSEATFFESKLDYLFLSQPIRSRGGVMTEVYNSRLEHSYDGLPKRSTLPDGMLSIAASDHFALYADVPLLVRPVLSVTFSQERVDEGDSGLTATISVSPVPSEPVEVSLSSWRDDRLAVPPSVMLSAAQASIVVPVLVPWLPHVEPHRAVVLTARAEGCMDGQSSVGVSNREAGSELIISKYHEPTTGSSGRSVELLNVSGRPIDFSRTALRLRRYSNGGTEGVLDAQAATGILPAGAVLVVGDESTGSFMVAHGLIPAPAQPFTSQLDHTVNFNAAGFAAFVKDQLVFTGNDALEVLVNGFRSDVFGEIGHDPGTAWTGPGSASTADATLTLQPALATGSSGWRLPGFRFIFTAPSLAGFGTAPVIADRYRVWTAANGLIGLNAALNNDPDMDGVDNLSAYAAPGGLTPGPRGLTRMLRADDPLLSLSIESSPNLAIWQTAIGSESAGPLLPDGTRLSTFTLSPVPGRIFLRQQIWRP